MWKPFQIFILMILFGCGNSDKKIEAENSLQSDINKIKTSSLNGDRLDLKQFKGKTVFINIWATWCKPCIDEMPTIKSLADSLKKEQIEFLFASEDATEDIQRFEASHKFGFNYVKLDNGEELNIMALPTTFIFNKEGKQVFAEMGYRKWDDSSNFNMISKIMHQ